MRSGGATGVVVKGPDDKSSVAFRQVTGASQLFFLGELGLNICLLCRMEDKGEVKCIKFSIGNKILAVQRTSKSVVSDSL